MGKKHNDNGEMLGKVFPKPLSEFAPLAPPCSAVCQQCDGEGYFFPTSPAWPQWCDKCRGTGKQNEES